MNTPLYVDLDCTLLRGDSLLEACMRLFVRPAAWPAVLRALFSGKAAFKQAVAARAEMPASALPYRQEFLGWLRSQRDSGRRLILATGADQATAAEVVRHLGLFTTAVFWSAEWVGHHYFSGEGGRYLGGGFGLCIGYMLKYWMDKKWVFKPASLN